MADFGVFTDLASSGVRVRIDFRARRTGRYKGGWRAAGDRLTASGLGGVIGTALGGGLLGVSLAAFGRGWTIVSTTRPDEVASIRHLRPWAIQTRHEHARDPV